MKEGFALLELTIAMTLATVVLTGLVALGQKLTERAVAGLDLQLQETQRRSAAEVMDGCALTLALGCTVPASDDVQLSGTAVSCALLWPDSMRQRVVAGCNSR